MEGRPRLLCLNHEVRQAEDLLRQMVPKMITIKLTLDTDLRKVAADPLHIEQILLNLGSNAADAMPDGGRLIIETRNVELDRQFCKEHVYVVPGSYVLLTVSDTGVGMNATTAAHIFDPFFTTKAAGKGTGMGLASVYGIVKNLEGYILCHSEPDKGSAFDIYLPAAAETESHDDEAMAEMAPRGGTETILVVDDEAAIRETAGEMLTHYGYTVLFAENGEAAHEIFRYRKSDIRLGLWISACRAWAATSACGKCGRNIQRPKSSSPAATPPPNMPGKPRNWGLPGLSVNRIAFQILFPRCGRCWTSRNLWINQGLTNS
ncbi:MAG: ATP-binding protein [Desulfobacterales bacterium]